jgi:hypothetical protein
VLATGRVWSVNAGDQQQVVLGVLVPADAVGQVASAAATDAVTVVWVSQ